MLCILIVKGMEHLDVYKCTSVVNRWHGFDSHN